MMISRRLHHGASLVLVLLFLTGIYAPFLGGLLQEDEGVSQLEKRRLASRPGWPDDLAALQAYTGKFADYWADHFGFRESLVSWYKQLKYHLGDAPSPDVIVGKAGWLFLGGIRKGYSRYDDPVGDARHVNLFTAAGLRQFSIYLSALHYWLGKQGVRYLFVLAPNKHSIYPEYLPDYVRPVGPESATDQLFSYLKNHPRAPALDLRPVLRAAKARGPVYFFRDSHWNDFGANFAQQAIRRILAGFFPGELDARLFPMKPGSLREGDLNGHIGLLPQTHAGLVPDFTGSCRPGILPPGAAPRDTYTRVCDRGRLRALIFRDSFFSRLEPYFSRVFARSTYVWQKIQLPLLRELLARERPDVVIEEWVERNLPRVPDIQPILRQIVQDGMGEAHSLPLDKLTFNSRMQVLFRSRDKLMLQSSGVDPYILIPLPELPAAPAYILRIRLYSSVRSGLELYHGAEGPLDFSPDRRQSHPLSAGDNDISFWLYADELGTGLRLDPLWAEGRVVLRGLEIIALKETAPADTQGRRP